MTPGCVYSVRGNVNLGQNECVGHRNRAAVSRVKYIQNVSLRQCGSRLREQAAALVSVIHSVGSFFQMDHPSRETMAQSSPSTFPCLYKGHWRSGPPSVRLRQPRWSLIYYFLFHLKVAGQTASFISFYEQGMCDQDSWDSHWHEAENCSCTNLIVPSIKRVHILTPSSYFVSSASGKLFFCLAQRNRPHSRPHSVPLSSV